MKKRMPFIALLCALLLVVVAFSLVSRGPMPGDVTPQVFVPVASEPAANPDGATQTESASGPSEQAEGAVEAPAQVGDPETQPADRVADLVSLQDSVDVETIRENPVGEYVPQTFEMGEEEAPYEPQVALVRMAEGARAEDVIQALAERTGTDPKSIVSYEFTPGHLHIALPEGRDLAGALNALESLEMVSVAQPNYYLVAAEDVGKTGNAKKVVEENVTEELEPAQSETSKAGDDESLGTSAAPDSQDAGQGTSDQRVTDQPSGSQEASGQQTTKPKEVESKESATTEMAVEDERADDAGKTDTRESSGEEAAPASGNEDGELSVQDELTAKEDATGSQPEAQGVSSATEAPGLEATAVGVNDPHRSKQWGLDSIAVGDAWTLAKGNRSVTVAVLDLGFELDHADLKANVVAPYNSYNALHGGNTSDVSPVSGSLQNHGTHVAGIIAAVANNGIGVAGASYNARVMPIKVVDPSKSASVESLVKAYDYLMGKASQYNVRVVNLSMGVRGTLSKGKMLTDKIDEAYNKGIVTVAAAGNSAQSGPYKIFPGDYEKVVSVINLKQNGSGVTKSASSNYNMSGERSKNISAPGDSIYSTVTTGDYGYMSGTSMATPHVSSVLALEFTANPSMSAADAVSTLYATATDIGASGWDSTYGWGEVNAYRAVRGAKQGAGKATVPKTDEDGGASEKAKQDKIDSTVANGLSYTTHVQNVGWQPYVKNGATAGTSGRSLRLEGIKIKLTGMPYAGSIQYRTHIQNVGWQGWRSDNALSGTSGQSLRLEAIQIRLTGDLANRYDVWYHVHAQDIGWMGWTKNGEASGTAGYGKRLEGIQILIRPKGSAAPGSTAGSFTFPISYQTHVQNVGWQGLVSNGAMSGTSGRGLRLEGIKINVSSLPFDGTVQYRTHIQNVGWEQGWRSSGQMSGTSGRSLRLEAIQIRLSGDFSNRYDVWYRTHVQNYGWTGWAKNGVSSGSAGKGYRLEGIQIRLVGKNGSAPGSTANSFYQ